MKLTHTRHTAETGIAISHIQPGQWQHVDTTDARHAQVGPQYKTKDEILADHEGYLVRAGWMKAD